MNLPKRPNKPEKVYADFDTDYQCWSVFGLSSGFCYAQPHSQAQAEQFAEEHNARVQ